MKCLKMRQSINTCIAQPIQTAYIYTCITEEMKASQLCCTHTIEREAFVHFDVTLTKKQQQQNTQWIELKPFYTCDNVIQIWNH